ncbi:MAG: hypothetical protein GY757_03015 [bacterium]|nr:hypothetical protein [bacterium]
MEAGIKQVAGVIGGSPGDMERREYTMEVRLWFESEKKARYADIGHLIIRAVGAVNYEYAINAVILELTSDLSRPCGSTRDIPVSLDGNPHVSGAAMKMLRDYFHLEP